MDPVTAFSLACGIIQVIDFSARVISKCQEIYKTGSLSENDDLESTAGHLTTLQADLAPPASANGAGAPTPGDRELLELSSKCTGIAANLIQELQSIKAQIVPATSWKAISLAFKSLKKKSVIGRMQKQLDQYRTILDTTILADLRSVEVSVGMSWYGKLANRIEEFV